MPPEAYPNGRKLPIYPGHRSCDPADRLASEIERTRIQYFPNDETTAKGRLSLLVKKPFDEGAGDPLSGAKESLFP